MPRRDALVVFGVALMFVAGAIGQSAAATPSSPAPRRSTVDIGTVDHPVALNARTAVLDRTGRGKYATDRRIGRGSGIVSASAAVAPFDCGVLRRPAAARCSDFVALAFPIRGPPAPLHS